MRNIWLRRLLSLTLILTVLAGAAVPCFAIEPPDDVVCTAEEEAAVWLYLMELTQNPIGAAGIMGNLFYESHLSPRNLETMGKRKPVFENGEDYATAVDKGHYTEFTTDGFGYGLAQWTYSGRKQRMLDIAKENKTSISDLNVQLQLIGEELEKFNMLYRISHADNLDFVAEYVLEHFENPQNQGKAEKRRRAKKARYFYDKFYKNDDIKGVNKAQRTVANVATYSEAYGIDAEEGLCLAWASDVLRTAGFRSDVSPSAIESAKKYAVSDDLTLIPVGAAIYGHSSSKYGHIGIYVGNNQVYHNVGGVQVDTLEDFIVNYRGFCWGWIGGTNLQKVPDEP